MMFKLTVLCFLTILSLLQVFISYSNALPQRGSGKYKPDNSGKYSPESVDKWAYKHDNRGKYVHVHIPYNGGYGPFQNPYEHDGRPYEHDDHPYEDKNQKVIDPFSVEVYTDKTPAVYREYGAPLFNSKF